MIKPIPFFLLLFLLFPYVSSAAIYHEYEIGWRNPESHILEITLLADAQQDDYTDFSIPSWRPGRYIEEHYSSLIFDVEAHNVNGSPLNCRKINTHTWRVYHGEISRIEMEYKFYAVGIDAGSTYLGADQLFLNPVNVCMYVLNGIDEPVRIFFPDAPTQWEMASSIDQKEGDANFFADTYHELVDSPIMMGRRMKSLNFELHGANFHMHFHGDYRGGVRTDEEAIRIIRQICDEAYQIFGSFPFDSYHFLYRLLPYDLRHAVEHANSAAFALPARITESPETISGGIGSISAHEFWHVWNVKRLRPAALLPYNYTEPPYSGLHWFTEGVTNYYADILLVRSGNISIKSFLEKQANMIAEAENHPAVSLHSPYESSINSWAANAFLTLPEGELSYYTLGHQLGFALDMALQERTKGKKCMDDLFLYLYKEYGDLAKGIAEDGIEKALNAISGSDWEPFFDAYVYGTEPLPYEKLSSYMGLTYTSEKREISGSNKIGLESYQATGQGILVRAIVPKSLLSKKGIIANDVILEWNEKPASEINIPAFCRSLKVGDSFRLKVFSDFQVKNIKVTYHKPATEEKISIIRNPKAKDEAEIRLEQWLRSRGE